MDGMKWTRSGANSRSCAQMRLALGKNDGGKTLFRFRGEIFAKKATAIARLARQSVTETTYEVVFLDFAHFATFAFL
jgi:hypothetical protein